ncbi:proteasome assembly chaperone family protein [Haloarchaeobius amylolyticus]|uniref:proteasome assembly chaperone family protein n=1 Tax=Haloarchaeobius amylolyticus TaxID=1198296 RepID=UPI00226FC0CF|nr:proteasome assembly chaperone family protein [Haloarchaeobius amylolyticus]
MEPLDIEHVAEAELSDPVFVEGLPGVGHVGKLAAEHILDQHDGELVRRVYSHDLPPQVDVDEEGIAELTHLEFHAVETDGRDLLVLTGDHQAQSNDGHYRLASAVLDLAEEFGCESAYALGGVPTGELIEEYAVLGAATDESLKGDLEDLGVEFREDEPAGGIVGVSGLVLGLGRRRDLDAACLMGETSGYLVDPKSAQAVLEILEERFEMDLDYASLEERADEMEEVIGKIQEMEQQQQASVPSDDDLRYIG